MQNGSGMHRVAESFAAAETSLGHDSQVVDCTVKSEAWDEACTADIHVVHTHFPDALRSKCSGKIVWIAHGTPDHVFQSSVESGLSGGYGHSDSLMLMQYWLRNADARVTFWPRHQWIYQGMVDKGTTVHCVPLGVDTAKWSSGVTRGKYAGTPSVLTCENAHYIKWPYDLFVAWPTVARAVSGATLHAWYLPRDQHRWFFPLVNANGASYHSHITGNAISPEDMPNILRSVDYYIGLVRNGDFNHMSLQAAASGVKTISYVGNPYATYWVPEGDQREIAKTLIDIFTGRAVPRDPTPVPDLSETATAMLTIYEGLLS